MALGPKWAAVKIPRTRNIGSDKKPKKTNIISAHTCQGCPKPWRAGILIKINMIYSLTGQSGPQRSKDGKGSIHLLVSSINVNKRLHWG